MAYGFNSDKSRVNINDATVLYQSSGVHPQDKWTNTISDQREITKELNLNSAIKNYDWIEIIITDIDSTSEYPPASGVLNWHEIFNVEMLFNQMALRGVYSFQLGWWWATSLSDVSESPPIVTIYENSGVGHIEIRFTVPGNSEKKAVVTVMGYGSHS